MRRVQRIHLVDVVLRTGKEAGKAMFSRHFYNNSTSGQGIAPEDTCLKHNNKIGAVISKHHKYRQKPMEKKITEWSTLANHNDYSAFAMARLRFPEGTPRLLFKRTRYLLLSLIYRNELKRMYFLFREPQFKQLPALHPEILEKPITPYIFARSTASKRAAMVEEHYRLVSTLFPDFIKPIYFDSGITLGHYPSNDINIRLGHHNTFRREGELDISLVNKDGDRLYSCAFSLTGTLQCMELIIGSVQGPEPSFEDAQDVIKSMTKEAFGLRPKSLVVQLVLSLAKNIGVHRVLAVKKNAHVLQAKRFSKDHRAKLHADYDELWAEFDAKDEDDNFVRLGPLKRKSLEDIASQKRSMYRRRYDWLDTLEQNIYLAFKREPIAPLTMAMKVERNEYPQMGYFHVPVTK